MIVVSYIMKRKIKKVFFEVISNSKIFNINFFQQTVNDEYFPNLQRGLDKGGDWTTSNTINRLNLTNFYTVLYIIKKW